MFAAVGAHLNRSVIENLGVPESFGVAVLLVAAALSLTAWLPQGADFGALKVPALPPRARRTCRWLGPVLLASAIALHMPLVPPAGASISHAIKVGAPRTVSSKVDTCPGKGVFYTRYEYVLENGSAQVQKTLLGIKPTGSGRPYIMDFEKSPSDAEASFSPHHETPYAQLPRFTLMRSLDVSLVLNAGSRLSVFVGICHAPGQDFLNIERKG